MTGRQRRPRSRRAGRESPRRPQRRPADGPCARRAAPSRRSRATAGCRKTARTVWPSPRHSELRRRYRPRSGPPRWPANKGCRTGPRLPTVGRTRQAVTEGAGVSRPREELFRKAWVAARLRILPGPMAAGHSFRQARLMSAVARLRTDRRFRRNLAVRPRSSEGRCPLDPVVHFCRAKGRFAIRRSYSWSEADKPLRST